MIQIEGGNGGFGIWLRPIGTNGVAKENIWAIELIKPKEAANFVDEDLACGSLIRVERQIKFGITIRIKRR